MGPCLKGLIDDRLAFNRLGFSLGVGMRGLKAEFLGRNSFDKWDSYVEGHAQGTAFHTTQWLQNCGQDLRVLVVVDSLGRFKGGLAVVKTRRFGVAGFHIPPFTPYGGPLVSPSEKEGRAGSRSEVQKVLTLLLANIPRGPHCDFILPPGEHELYPFVLARLISHLRLTHELCPGEDCE